MSLNQPAVTLLAKADGRAEGDPDVEEGAGRVEVAIQARRLRRRRVPGGHLLEGSVVQEVGRGGGVGLGGDLLALHDPGVDLSLDPPGGDAELARAREGAGADHVVDGRLRQPDLLHDLGEPDQAAPRRWNAGGGHGVGSGRSARSGSCTLRLPPASGRSSMQATPPGDAMRKYEEMLPPPDRRRKWPPRLAQLSTYGPEAFALVIGVGIGLLLRLPLIPFELTETAATIIGSAVGALIAVAGALALANMQEARRLAALERWTGTVVAPTLEWARRLQSLLDAAEADRDMHWQLAFAEACRELEGAVQAGKGEIVNMAVAFTAFGASGIQAQREVEISLDGIADVAKRLMRGPGTPTRSSATAVVAVEVLSRIHALRSRIASISLI